jgi:Ca2+-transporting ATPase
MLNQKDNDKKQIELDYQGRDNYVDPQLLEKGDDYFNITNDEITKVIQSYLQKTTDEDLRIVAEYGGVEGIGKKLKTDINKGLDFSNKEDIAKRTEIFGVNHLEEEKMKNCCQFVWEAFEDLMIRILVAAAIIQTVLGATVGEDPAIDWIDGISIIIAVVVVVTVGSITNYSKEKQFKKINDEKNAMTLINVTRRGENLTIFPSDILVGDIVQIQVGSIIPADFYIKYLYMY